MSELHVIASNPDQPPENPVWLEREKRLMERANKHIARYKRIAVRSRQCARAISVVTLVCSLLAPVAVVATAGASGGLFGLSQTVAVETALVLTLILAFSEGLRRSFRFEQRWSAAVVAGFTIEKIREIYLDNQAEHILGSDSWIRSLVAFRDEMDAVAHSEAQEFFQTVLSREKQLSAVGRP
jgi:hypothetical protein